MLASDPSPQSQHGGTPRVWPLEMLLIPHLHGNVPTWGFCSMNKICDPPLCKETPTQGAALCPCGSAEHRPWGAAGGCPQAPLPHPKASPEGRASTRCAQRRAGFADSATHTLCKCPPAAAPAAVCSGCVALFAFRGITMEGDGLSAAGKWGKAAPGICPKDPAQGWCRLLSGCNPSARPKLNPPWSSRSYRKMHPPQNNPAATQPGKLFIIISLQQRYGKKAPALASCKQQQLQLPRRELCTSQ